MERRWGRHVSAPFPVPLLVQSNPIQRNPSLTRRARLTDFRPNERGAQKKSLIDDDIQKCRCDGFYTNDALSFRSPFRSLKVVRTLFQFSERTRLSRHPASSLVRLIHQKFKRRVTNRRRRRRRHHATHKKKLSNKIVEFKTPYCKSINSHKTPTFHLPTRHPKSRPIRPDRGKTLTTTKSRCDARATSHIVATIVP